MKIKFCFTWILFIQFTGLFAQEINQKDAAGSRHGFWTGLYKDTKNLRYEGTFDHGKEVGVFYYYDNVAKKTLIATRTFDNVNNAVYIVFYDVKKNKVSEGKVILDTKKYDGLWKYYHKNSSKLMTSENYVNGKLEGVRTIFYPNGKITEETNYINGIKNGVYKKYTEKGVVLEQSHFKNGEYEGEAVYYNAKGEILIRGNFKNGKKSGTWKFFEDRKLLKEENMNQVKKSVKRKRN